MKSSKSIKIEELSESEMKELISIKPPEWRGDVRALPNALIRSALFSVRPNNQRELVKSVRIASNDGIEIFFSGETLNQDDLTVWEAITELNNVFHEEVVTTTNEIFEIMDRHTKKKADEVITKRGGSQIRLLYDSIHRLAQATIVLKAHGMLYIGHLIDRAYQSMDASGRPNGWVFRIDIRLKRFIAPNQVTKINWNVRRRLSKTQLAQWVQNYYSTHSDPYPVTISRLREMVGSKNTVLRSFRSYALRSLERLKEECDREGVNFSYEYDRRTDTIHFFKNKRIAHGKNNQQSLFEQ